MAVQWEYEEDLPLGQWFDLVRGCSAFGSDDIKVHSFAFVEDAGKVVYLVGDADGEITALDEDDHSKEFIIHRIYSTGDYEKRASIDLENFLSLI